MNYEQFMTAYRIKYPLDEEKKSEESEFDPKEAAEACEAIYGGKVDGTEEENKPDEI